jgi:hypothetical protein
MAVWHAGSKLDLCLATHGEERSRPHQMDSPQVCSPSSALPRYARLRKALRMILDAWSARAHGTKLASRALATLNLNVSRSRCCRRRYIMLSAGARSLPFAQLFALTRSLRLIISVGDHG